MERRVQRCFLGILLLIGGPVLGSEPDRASDEMISLGAGNVVGVYYAAGSGMAKIFNKKRGTYHQWLVTVATQGSVDNIDAVLAGTHPFGLAQDNMLDKAIRGKDPWTAPPEFPLQAVFGLYIEALTVVAAGDRDIAGLPDLKGKRVNIGAPGSSDGEYARELLTGAGLRLEDLKLVEEPSYKASDLLEEGKIDAYIYTVGHPALSVREATAGKRRARLLPLAPALIGTCLAANPILKETTIPTEHYPDLEDRPPVPTVGTRVILFTRAGMDEETVYRIAKEVMTNLDLFRRQQPALAELKAEEMAAVTGIPLHPGARRYFREAGLLP